MATTPLDKAACATLKKETHGFQCTASRAMLKSMRTTDMMSEEELELNEREKDLPRLARESAAKMTDADWFELAVSGEYGNIAMEDPSVTKDEVREEVRKWWKPRAR